MATVEQQKSNIFGGKVVEPKKLSQGANGLKYNTTNFTYPIGTGTAGEKTKDSQTKADLKHYVVFFINIRGKSKYKPYYDQNGGTAEITKTDENRLDKGSLATATKVALTAGAAYVGAKVGSSAAQKIIANAGKTKTITKVIGTAAGAATGIAAGATAANWFENDKTYRISTAIKLALQSAPRVDYGVRYSEEDLGLGAGLIAGGTSAVDSGLLQAGGEAANAMLLNAAQIPSGIANAMGANLDAKAMASLGTGTTMNPFREQIFKSVNTRTFSFNYKFLARTAQEAEYINRIITTLKWHMHPELSDGGLFYIYPSEFNIAYYYEDQINTHLNRISTCVLENLSLDYGGQNGFAAFGTPSWSPFQEDGKAMAGMPSEINMTLRFRELETMTRERINVGF
jgi:hypothetical protein